MARPLELKASKDSGAGKWRVNVPPGLSESGRRERRFFDTQGSATAFIEELRCRRDNLAAIDRTLSPAQLLDAAAALNILADYPQTSLLEAARGYLAALKMRSGSITLGELFARFLEAKRYKSKFYLRDIGWASDRLAPLRGRLVSDISRRELTAILAPLPDSSRNNMLRTLRALFRYGHDLGYLQELPVRRSDFAPVKKNQIEVLPVRKLRRLLEAALEHEPDLLPLLPVEIFCGVRPAEAVRILWSDIDLVRGRLTIRAAISKTGTARSIQLAPCALAWIKLCAPGKGPIITDSESRLRTRLRKVRYHAGYRGAGVHWTPGSLRDAFCSYHLAHYGSIDRLITEAGHSDLRTTRDHYLGLVSPEQAAKFWNLLPPGHSKKVIQFATG